MGYQHIDPCCVVALSTLPLPVNFRIDLNRYFAHTADGAVHELDKTAWRALFEALAAEPAGVLPGRRLVHCRTGLDRQLNGWLLEVGAAEAAGAGAAANETASAETASAGAAGAEAAGTEADPEPPKKTESRPETAADAIAQMVALGKERRPELATRLEAAAGLVAGGWVTFPDEETAKCHGYVVGPERCECADFRYRSRWCKHRLAVRMARHLVRNGFDLPPRIEEPVPPGPQLTEADRRLIESNEVIDAARRRERAFRSSSEGARRYILSAAANGATTFPADVWAKANGQGAETNGNISGDCGHLSDKEICYDEQ